MKVTAESKHTEEMLLLAMEMLNDIHLKMEMFERQRYGKLKHNLSTTSHLTKNFARD
jgi:hypothetical protein